MRFIALPVVFALAAFTPAFAQSPGQARTARQDTEFLKSANQGSVDEINLAQIALDKSTDPDVKDFAQRMVHDHTQLLDDMKSFDAEAGLTIPDHSSVSTLAEEAKLKILTGDTFDKAYIKEMVAGHHKVLVDLIAEQKSTGYPAFRDAVHKGAGVVREHLEMINGIAKKNGIAPAPAPAIPAP